MILRSIALQAFLEGKQRGHLQASCCSYLIPKPTKYSSRPALITHQFVIKSELGSSQFVVVVVVLLLLFVFSQFPFLQEAVTN